MAAISRTETCFSKFDKHHIFPVKIVKKHALTVPLQTYTLFSFDVETSSHYL